MLVDSENRFSSWFNDAIAPDCDSLYEPLAQETNICGVGIRLILVHDPPLHVKSNHYSYITIIDSIDPHTPAAKAGLQPGDIMVQVRGVNLEDGQQVYVPDDVSNLIRGSEGSKVVVGVERDGRKLMFELTREPLDTLSTPVPTFNKSLFSSPLPKRQIHRSVTP